MEPSAGRKSPVSFQLENELLPNHKTWSFYSELTLCNQVFSELRVQFTSVARLRHLPVPPAQGHLVLSLKSCPLNGWMLKPGLPSGKASSSSNSFKHRDA